MTRYSTAKFEQMVREGRVEVEYGPSRCGHYQVRSTATNKRRTVVVG